MNQSHGLRLAATLVLIVLVAGLAWAADTASKTPVNLSPIVGNANQWKLSEQKPGAAKIQQSTDGTRVLQVEKDWVALDSAQAWGPDSEVIVRFRLPQQGKKIFLSLETALTNADDPKDHGIFLTINPGDERTVKWNSTRIDPTEGERQTKNGSYAIGIAAARKLSWSESFRKQVAADHAAGEAVADHWFTLRAAVGKEQVDFWLDDVPLSRAAKAGLKTNGIVRLRAQGGVEIASLSARQLKAGNVSEIYRPIALEPVLNADQVAGQQLNVSALAAKADRSMELDAVPFVLPQRNGRGSDHVDVGTSWLRQGNLEGRFAGDKGDFGGRWAGALLKDPSRIQLRVPNERYRALHLLAVSDGEPDSVPIVTAQFFRSGTGLPINFVSPAVPSADETSTIAVKSGGKNKYLHHIVIPIDPGALAAFANQEYLALELTKQVRTYRAYPDPLFYSMHGAGLPSGVHIFAATLERPTVDVNLTANAYAHIWTAPAKPTYTVKIDNIAGAARPIELKLVTRSFFGNQTTEASRKLNLDKTATAEFALTLPCYGYHDLTLTVIDGKQTWQETRSLAYLHEDTRERGNWASGKGALFGYWHWGGSHDTPNHEKTLLAMGQAGAETVHAGLNEGKLSAKARETAQRFKIRSYVFGGGDHHLTSKFVGALDNNGLEAAGESFLKSLKGRAAPDGDTIRESRYLAFFSEPGIGPYTHAMMPDYYGEPEPVFSPEEEKLYQRFLNAFVEGSKIAKEHFPQAKCMLPWGDPVFAVPFLRRSEEVRKLIDGVMVDIPAFERLPEQQIHQVSIHRLFVTRNEFRKAGIENPILAIYEGPCVPTGPGALSDREASDLGIRNSLILQAYGVDIQTGGFLGFDTAAAWGEQHYGSGVLRRIPLEMPKPGYAAMATHTRMLNRCNFDGWTPTGSLSVYALRFKHYKSGKLVHVLWTIRGTRPVNIAVPAGTKVELTDLMDNTRTLEAKNGQVSFTVDSSPCYLTGLPADIQITLGEPNHSDAKPAPVNQKLANFGDGSWTLSDERDTAYEQSHFPYIVRFQDKMTIAPADAPAKQGGKALAVHLETPEKLRTFMPHYSTLVPAKPIVIPGKASHLGVWVKAASDWGRVVYFLTDANGERWISVGKAGAWNNDDIHSWTSFNFDGWRYLRFELPANSPYDGFREAGSTWWGAYGSGDRMVDLPLKLEKVVVERRTHAMHVNDPQPVPADDVLLGDLIAEYETSADQTPEAVRLASLRMPEPANLPELGNPIKEMAAAGTGAPMEITRITLPEQDSDGTQCYVHFDKQPDTVTYDIWASPHPDGQGALQVAKGWKEPGGRARGFRPDTDYYLFVVYVDQNGKASKPSAPFKIHLKDLFGMK